MHGRRWAKRALIAGFVAVALFFLLDLSVFFGAPVEMVGLFSNLSLLALAAAFVLLALAGYRRVKLALSLAVMALAGEIGAALLLSVREPQPAFEHPEWAWYWPVVNTLYFGGFLVALLALISGVAAAVLLRSRMGAVAFFVGLGAVAANRIATYR